jgi:5-methylcytosine-specific restriction endonuclease McrA
MACKNCGSDGLDGDGNDCNKCPHCCKGRRCDARKKGLWPSSISKACRVCGVQFSVNPNRHRATVCDSETCQKKSRNADARVRVARWKAGLARKRRPAAPKKVCKREGCNAFVKVNCHQYCSKACRGADARELKCDWGGVPCEVRKAAAFAKSLTDWDWKKPRRHKKRPPCEHCGNEIKMGASRFCSYDCVSAWKGDRTCENCGVIVQDCHAYSKARCEQCRAESKRNASRRAKKKYGRNHRQRARHHGVTYVSVPVAAIYERDGYLCQLCGKRCFKAAKYSKLDGRIHPRSPTIDHIVAMACGGNHEPGNLQTACFECNSRKGARSIGQLRMEFV